MSIHHSIGDLAKQTGVKVVTIRYYEQTGLYPRQRAQQATTEVTTRDISGNYALSVDAAISASRSNKFAIYCDCLPKITIPARMYAVSRRDT